MSAMLKARCVLTRSVASCSRGMASTAAAAPGARVAAAPDAEHAAWLASIKGYKVVVPKFEWSLEWALPTPVPQHQFEQSPVVIEVTDRNPAPERLIADGPDTAGGYPDPLEKAGTDKFLTPAEAKARGYGRSAYTREWFTPQGVKKSSPDEAGLFTSAAR